MRLRQTGPAEERPLFAPISIRRRPASGEVADRGRGLRRLPHRPPHPRRRGGGAASHRARATRPRAASSRSARASRASRPGDRVGVGWIASTCGRCAVLRLRTREPLCLGERSPGGDRDGGYAERMTADARWVYPAARRIRRRATRRRCSAPGSSAIRSLRLSGIAPGGRLGLFGFGASAHLAIQVARHWGCEVYAFTREQRHRELALRDGRGLGGRSGRGSGRASGRGGDLCAGGRAGAGGARAPRRAAERSRSTRST